MGIGVGVKTNGGRPYMGQAPIEHKRYSRRFKSIQGVHTYGKVMKTVVWAIALGMVCIAFVIPAGITVGFALWGVITAKERSAEFNKLARLPKDTTGKKTIHITF